MTAIVFLAASSAPTPLYAIFRESMSLTPLDITGIFAIYAIALLVSLLIVGSLSDHLGRKPVILVALVLEAISMAIFIVADDASGLFLARGLQGVATGAATTALTAALTDLSAVRGQHVNSVTPLLGMALGALGAAAIAASVVNPAPVVFWGLIILLSALFLATLTIEETTSRRPGAVATLRVHLAVPRASRTALLKAVPVLVAVWAIGGFMLSLGPSLAETLSGSSDPSPLLGGAFVTTLTASGAVAITALAKVSPSRTLAGGSASLAVGVAVIIVAVGLDSIATLFAGAVVAGIGFGAGFQGVLRSVMPTAPMTERASLAATVYAISYFSMSVPAVGAGVVASHWGIEAATIVIGCFVITLALAALVAMGGSTSKASVSTHAR